MNKIVIIEDEPDHAEAIRTALESAVSTRGPLKGMNIYPPRRTNSEPASYTSMEAFTTSEEGFDQTIKAFIIIDLFLARRVETPSVVFHQLMYNLFWWERDASLVCGRLGILSKLRELYRESHCELFTYFPTYFGSQNESVTDDSFIYRDFSLRELERLVKKSPEKLREFCHLHPEARGESSAINLMQTLAMRDALYERIRGIFYCQDVFDHITQGTTPPARKVIGSRKSDEIFRDTKALVEKIERTIERL